MAEHALVELEEQPKSMAAYRFYAECLCGFQTRQSTKELAQSQFSAHLRSNGVIEEQKVGGSNTVIGTKEEKKSWNPFSK